jgi:hypothetical protein
MKLALKTKSARPLLVALVLTTAARVGGETVYFLMAERGDREMLPDSFVLPLNRPWDIAEARRLIREVPLTNHPSIGVEVAYGADGINRDHLAVGAPPWSWHVVDPRVMTNGIAFVFGATSPSSIEPVAAAGFQTWTNTVYPLLHGTNRFVGFERYAFVAELARPGYPAVSIGYAPSGAVALTWTSLGPGYNYEVETADSLPAGRWEPIPFGHSRTSYTRWYVSPDYLSERRFFRIRADRAPVSQATRMIKDNGSGPLHAR